MNSKGTLLTIWAILLAFGTYSQCGPLSTPTVTNNGQSGIMFDIVAITNVEVTQFGIDFDNGTYDIEVYSIANTHVGNETNAGAWTLLGSVTGWTATAGTNVSIPVTFSQILCPGESAGFYVTASNSTSGNYSNGTGVGNIAAADANIQILEGTGKAYPFGTNFTPRVPNITVFYNCLSICCIPPSLTTVPLNECSPNTVDLNNGIDGTSGPGNASFYSNATDAANATNSISSTVSTTGTYHVRYESLSDPNCYVLGTIDVTITPAPNAGTITGTSPLCPSGTSNLNSDGDAGGTWSSSDPAIATVDAAGLVTGVSPGTVTISYEVSATAPCTGSDIATFDVTVTPTANAGTITGTSPLCPSGTATYTSNGDTGGTWSSSDPAIATVDAAGLVTGVGTGTATISYEVFATAPCTGSDIATYDVTITSTPNAGTITGTTGICLPGTSSLNSDGDAGGTWNSSDPTVATVDATGLVTTVGLGTATISYEVAATAPCTGSDIATLDVTVSAPPNAGMITGTSPLCPSGTSTYASDGDVGGVWTSSDPAVATVDAAGVVTGVGPGTATISYEVLATAPCTGSDIATFNVTVTSTPNAGTLTGSTNICALGTSSLSSDGDAGGSWSSSDPGVATVDAAGLVTGVGSGTATISYEVTATAPCTGSDIATLDITVTNAPNAGTITGMATMCPTGTATYISDGDAGGSWTSSDPTIASVDAAGLVTGVSPGMATISYEVSATAPCTGSDIATFDVTVTSTPNAGTITGTANICALGSSSLLSDGDAGGNWSSSDPAIVTVDAAGLVTAIGAGTATISYEVTAIAPCTGSDVATLDITVTASPNAGTITGLATMCPAGTSSFTSDGDAGGVWSSSDPGILTVDAAGLVTAISTGTATVSYEVAATAPCTGSDIASYNVTVSVTPEAGTNGSITLCSSDGSVDLFTLLGGSPDLGGTWSPALASGSGLLDPSVDVGGLYTYTVSNGCGSASADVDVIVNIQEDAGFSYSAQQYCIDASNPVPTITGTPGGVFTISGSGLIDAATGEIDITSTGSGSFQITYSTTGACSDVSTQSVTILEYPNIILTPVDDLCSTESPVTLLASPGGGTWTGVGVVAGTTTFDPSIAVGTNTLTYTITGACGASESITINVTETPAVTTISDTIIEGGSSIELTTISSGTNISWTPGTGLDCTDCLSPMATPETETTYVVSVTENGCTTQDVVTIGVVYTPVVFVPNIFSPNADGSNDVLYVRGQGFRSMSFVVYDRWGEKVFESTDKNVGWDGTFRGKKMNPAVFVYYLKVVFEDNSEQELKGDITLIR